MERIQLGRRVVAVAREELDLARVDASEQPVSVELDLEAPVGVVAGRGVDQRRQLRAECRGQRACPGVRMRRRISFRAAAAGTRHHRGLDDLVDCVRAPRLPPPSCRRAACGLRIWRFDGRLGAVGKFVDHAELGRRSCVLVPLLDQQPRLLFLAASLHADQRPLALELVASQFELQVAGFQRRVRIADRLPCAFVPDDDLARSVLPRRDGALEAGIRDRRILDMGRLALVLRAVAGPLGDGPGQHDAIEFDPEVVVQTRRPSASGRRSSAHRRPRCRPRPARW